MLSATGIHKGFDGLGVLRGIDLNVEKGEVVRIGLAHERARRLVAADERRGVERGDGLARERRVERLAGGVHGEQPLPVLGRVAKTRERRPERRAVGAGERGLAAPLGLRELPLDEKDRGERVAAGAHAARRQRVYLRRRLVHARAPARVPLARHAVPQTLARRGRPRPAPLAPINDTSFASFFASCVRTSVIRA